MLLPEIQALLAAAGDAPALDLSMPVGELRELCNNGVLATHAYVRAPSGPVETHDVLVPVAGGESPARVYRRVDGARDRGMHLHFHGGGWWMGSLDTCDAMMRELAAASGLVVVSATYRLAPEHRWPQAPEDGYAALQWVAEHAAELGGGGARISIGGESAGANIAAAVGLMARDRNGPNLAGQWLDIAAVDLTLPDDESLREFGVGFGLDVTAMRQLLDWYVAPADRRHPYASPALADLSGLPPTLVTTAGCDPLRDQAERYASRLGAAGVAVDSRRAAGHIHGTTWLTRLTASAARWHDGAVEWLQNVHAVERPVLTA